MMRSITFTLLTLFILKDNNNDANVVNALAPPILLTAPTPILGIGALLFRPRNIKFVKSSETDSNDEALTQAGKFFVDAFWTGKVGGADTLSSNQANTLERQQIMEFKKRYKVTGGGKGKGNNLPGNYAGRSIDSTSELVLCLDGKGECIGCAGVEYDTTFTAPLMSNLAISRSYRRKGLAESLVKATELIAQKEWGYDDVYLYVEKRNAPAVKLYKKLGYRTLWEDDSATTLLPMKDGKVANGKTTIVCMKKRLGGGLFG